MPAVHALFDNEKRSVGGHRKYDKTFSHTIFLIFKYYKQKNNFEIRKSYTINEE